MAGITGNRIVTDGLVFYFDFDNLNCYESGTKCFDLTSSGNIGTLTNGVSFNNGVFDFDGVDDYIDVADSDSISITGDITISSWIKITDFSNYRGIVGKTNGNQPGPFDFYLDIYSGNPTFFIGNGSSFAGYSVATTAPQTGVWENIVVTFNIDTITHYLNGIPDGFTDIGTPPFSIADRGTSMRIGSRDDSATIMEGSVASVQIYYRALSSDEILQNYNALKPRFS
jgi:hypothetical protein